MTQLMSHKIRLVCRKTPAVSVSLALFFFSLPSPGSVALASFSVGEESIQPVDTSIRTVPVAPTGELAPQETEPTSPADGPADSLEFLQESPVEEIPLDLESEMAEEDQGGKGAVHAFAINDPYFNSTGSWGQSFADLYGVKQVVGPNGEAWNISKGEGVTVAVIDSGVDFTHSDLGSNKWINTKELNGKKGKDDDGNGFIDDIYGWDFVKKKPLPATGLDGLGHGTHVAGIIAADLNSQGMVGVAPKAKIMSVRVLDPDGSGDWGNLARGIHYAAKSGAKIINISLGGHKSQITTNQLNFLKAEVKFATDRGCVLVAAAGNSYQDVSDFYPASLPGVIAVGATDPSSTTALFSNFGSRLNFVAPGVGILSTLATGMQGWFNTIVGSNFAVAAGTSMASPMVAGAVALLQAWKPSITYTEILNRLKLSAQDLGAAGFDKYYGWGLVNAFGALTVNLAGRALSNFSAPAIQDVPVTNFMGLNNPVSGPNYVVRAFDFLEIPSDLQAAPSSSSMAQPGRLRYEMPLQAPRFSSTEPGRRKPSISIKSAQQTTAPSPESQKERFFPPRTVTGPAREETRVHEVLRSVLGEELTDRELTRGEESLALESAIDLLTKRFSQIRQASQREGVPPINDKETARPVLSPKEMRKRVRRQLALLRQFQLKQSQTLHAEPEEQVIQETTIVPSAAVQQVPEG